jgi:hypothetical protein
MAAAAAPPSTGPVEQHILPQPETAHLKSTSSIPSIQSPPTLPFNPSSLKAKYLAERDKRLANNPSGVEQYLPAEGNLAHYLEDPWAKPEFTRGPVDEHVEVVVIGGGYGAQLVAAKLIERGVRDIRLVEKGGDFGGTWYGLEISCSSFRSCDL